MYLVFSLAHMQSDIVSLSPFAILHDLIVKKKKKHLLLYEAPCDLVL